MALAVKREARMSVAEYRRWVEPRPEEERWELLVGEPVRRAPPSARHQRLVLTVAQRLDAMAQERGCGADPGLAILSAALDDAAPIPDVVVPCGPPLPDGYPSDPLLVAEVLSPSTMSLDRGRKIDFCRTVPGLAVLLIVYSDEARGELWRRDAADGSVTALGLEGTVTLPELDGAVPVRDIYRGLSF